MLIYVEGKFRVPFFMVMDDTDILIAYAEPMKHVLDGNISMLLALR